MEGSFLAGGECDMWVVRYDIFYNVIIFVLYIENKCDKKGKRIYFKEMV